MEPKFNTSFIPKKTLPSGPGLSLGGSRGFNIFSTLSTIIFILTIATYGGLYIYKNILITRTGQASQELDKARASFETEKIQSLVNDNNHIIIAKGLLEKHVVVSELLILLQYLTVKKMRFSALSYSSTGAESSLLLDAEGQTYNAMAEQADAFSTNGFFKNLNVSNFALAENGIIKAKFSMTLDPELVSYKSLVDSSSNQ